MIVLGVETTTKINSLALLKNEKILDETAFCPEDASKEIFISLSNFLKRNKISLNEIGLFAVSLGPGSWTGIRIGISLVKGFATALKKKAIGIYSSDILAEAVRDKENKAICTLIKAEKALIYRAFYQNGKTTQIKKVSLEDLIKEIEKPTIFIGDALFIYGKEIKEKLGNFASFADSGLWRSKASFLARLGYRQFREGRKLDLRDLRPFYGETQYLTTEQQQKKIATTNLSNFTN